MGVQDDFDVVQEWIEKMVHLRNALAHIPHAARHQHELAISLQQEIEKADLPVELKPLWEEHKQVFTNAGICSAEFAERWDRDFPIVRARPEAG